MTTLKILIKVNVNLSQTKTAKENSRDSSINVFNHCLAFNIGLRLDKQNDQFLVD